MVIFESFNEFLDSYKLNPIATLDKLSVNRKFSERPMSKNNNKNLQKRLEEGSTLEEFFELISVNQNESIGRLLNTWLSLKDKIEEEKGTFPLKDGIWKISYSTVAYLDLDNSPLNNLEVSEVVLEKFFKCYSPLRHGDKYELNFEYGNKTYAAHILKTDDKLLLHWDDRFVNVLKNLYADFDLNNIENEKKIDYSLMCRFYWNNYYKGISVYLDINEIMIQISNDVNNEILIQKPIMDKFFDLESENANYTGELIDLNLEKDIKLKFKGYIRNDNNKFILRWDEKFISCLNEKYQEVINEKNILFLKLRKSSWKPGERYKLIFDFITIEKSNNTTIKLNQRMGIDKEIGSASLSIEDFSLVEKMVEYSSVEDKEVLRKKILEALVNLESKYVLTTESKGQSRAEQHILRALLYGKNKTSVCEYCKKEFPVYYMKTAHIKKRKCTSNEEKLDANIVFALCPMCDTAFENGDIYVEDGFFNMNKRAYPDDLNLYLSKYNGSKCECYNEQNKQYFEWHRDHHVVRD